MRIGHGGNDLIYVRLLPRVVRYLPRVVRYLPRVVRYLLRCDGQSLRYGRRMRFEPRDSFVKLLLIGRKLSLLRDNKLHGSFQLFICHIQSLCRSAAYR